MGFINSTKIAGALGAVLLAAAIARGQQPASDDAQRNINPQTFVPNIFLAKAADYRSAAQQVYRAAKWPSSVVLPVVVGQRMRP